VRDHDHRDGVLIGQGAQEVEDLGANADVQQSGLDTSGKEASRRWVYGC
jgi:hypothetical protein